MNQNEGVYEGFYLEVLNFENLFLYSYKKVKFYIASSIKQLIKCKVQLLYSNPRFHL